MVHKIALDPNKAQATYFAKACGTARFAWNWALNEWQQQYQSGGHPSEISLRKQLNTIKDTQYPWMREVTKNAPQQAIKNLGVAFKRFFKHQAKYPRFKKKGQHDSFRADNGPPAVGESAVVSEGKRIKLAVIGWIRMREAVRFHGQIKSAVVSCTAGRWFVALTIETPMPLIVRKNHASTGVDLGINRLATLANGEQIEGPKPLKSALKKLQRAQRWLSRKVKGSHNRRNAAHKVAQFHARIANIRSDSLHKLTTRLVNEYGVIGIEDLHVKGMVRNHTLARAISDMGFGEFRRQLTYKAARYGSRLVTADRFFPSSKLCSQCGCIHDELTLKDRVFCCAHCGLTVDRDVNAARNLEHIASSTASSAESNACGVVSADAPSLESA